MGIDKIAADIVKNSKYKAPEQIDVMIRLARRVQELQAAQTPRPMETAPRDGRWLLLDSDEWGWMEWQGIMTVDDVECWVSRDGYAENSESFLRWLPLPPTPESSDD